MFEENDFDTLMERMLENVSDELDKREGSVIYDAIAPAALELANMYVALDVVMDEVFADTASYYYLIKRAAERGIYPKEETNAECELLVVPSDTQIAVNDRFALGEFNYTVASVIDATQGLYRLICETAGSAGNQQLGGLIPLETKENLNDMESATLTRILIPGEDEEDVEVFRERYFSSFNHIAFGGNKADYKEKINDIAGVGGCKVIRAWSGGCKPADMIPGENVTSWYESQSESTLGKDVYSWLKNVYGAAKEKLLTTGGTVKVIIITSEFSVPSDVLVNTVQTALDPEISGEGDGIAPIDHVVNVKGVQGHRIDILLNLVYKEGFTYTGLESNIKDSIDAYFSELAKTWSETENLTVRLSQIESRMLMIDGILDVEEVKLNGSSENIILEYDEIPIRGDVNI